MTKELEEWCQCEVDKLLKQKELFLNRRTAESQEPYDLPHYREMVALYKLIEERELFLLEIKDRIQALERKREVSKMKKAFSCLRLTDAVEKEEPKSAIGKWLKQMLLYERQNKHEFDRRLFLDVEFKETINKEMLTWTTLYKGYCMRVCASAPPLCFSSEPTDYSFSASLYVDGLVTEGQKAISTGMEPDEYVRTLWKNLQLLIDIC